MNDIKKIVKELRDVSDKNKAKIYCKFFKTGKGEYGEGDCFLGIVVPKQRRIAARYYNLNRSSVLKLLKSRFHEERLTALFILIHQFNYAQETEKKEIYKIYLAHTRYINNWDLVDSSAQQIVGAYLYKKNISPLLRLARSKLLWERRIAIIATYYFINRKNSSITIKIAKMLLKDKHDLIHKAVGWMLREVGKSCGKKILENFLETNSALMPRVMLRYAIEKLPQNKKEYYMKKPR